MYQKNDGRRWSKITINGTEIEMLWDSGASVTVMAKSLWERIGSPRLERSNITLCGVFTTGGEQPVGCMTIEAKWNQKIRKIKIIVVEDIKPNFIGGVDTMKEFGVKLIQVNNIEASLINKIHTNEERANKALLCLKGRKGMAIEKLIKEYGEIFMASKFDLGFTQLVRHEMRISGGPIMQQPRRQPMHMETKIEELIKELMNARVIRRCKSPWNAPLVIVGKKDGSIRMCVDYRGLNAITEKESFPMPNTRFLLDCLADARIFSSIDLGQAYYQVDLAPEAQEVTAFSTREGQFCFNRLPFGLSTAPATFQRLMHTLLDGMLFKGVVVYLDDILVYGKDQYEHDERLEKIFKKIQKAGLKINPEKCEFNTTELLFLGHTINEKGIQTNKKKVKEIEEAKIPKCSKQLRSFLGLTNYYRRFIKDYAKIAEPLYAATSGCEKEIVWTKECDDSFKTLKKRLCEAPILDYPREGREFILDTDASFGAIGAVLSQIKEDGDETVIAYGSRHMTAHEKGYCVTRKELLAIHEYVMHFKEYLYGKKFVVRTDHKALVFMNTTKTPISPQFQTWLANLAEYDFQLKYRKGEEHSNADGLSRLNGMICTQCQTRHEQAKEGKSKVRHIYAIQKTDAMEKTLEHQQNCIKFCELREMLENSNTQRTTTHGGFPFNLKNVRIDEGLLTVEKNGNVLILVPETYSGILTTTIHEELCHIGVKKLLNYIEKIFYWPRMQETIQICLQCCDFCAKRKIDQKRTKEIFIPRESSEFLEQIVIDVAYMEKTATKKYMVVIIDRFSKLVSLTATAKQDEETIFKIILNSWIYRFGKPKSILTDRGRNFESKFLGERLKKLGISQEFSSPYQHQSNGLAERAIRTVRDLITTTLAGGCVERNWHELLPRIEFSINCSRQSSTGFSPFEIIYGRRVNLHSNMRQSTEQRQDLIHEAKDNSDEAAKRMRLMDETKRGSRFFSVGEEVLVRKEPHKRQKDGMQYDGPYKIVQFLTPHRVELQTPNGTKERRIEWLKKWQRF